MKKIYIIFSSLILIVIFAGCTQIVVNDSDEIKMNVWEYSNKNYSSVKLSFKNNKGRFSVISKDNTLLCDLKGIAIIDSKNIIIFNENDKENYIFSYSLKSNKLSLEYSGGKVILDRVT